MKLYTLLAGKSKKKMVRLETNAKHKCENYMKALKGSNLKQYKWFEIREALPDEELKVHKSQNAWTGYDESGPFITNFSSSVNFLPILLFSAVVVFPEHFQLNTILKYLHDAK